jgi:cobalt-zinc-cadmium efflux system protein
MQKEKKLLLALLITTLVCAAEVAGGLLTNSLALLSDSLHVFMDVFALVITLSAVALAARPSTTKETFGLHRLEILAALINGLSVFAIAIVILYASYLRLLNAEAIQSTGMLIIAILGLIGNIATAYLLSIDRADLNMRGAYLHVLGDTLSSIAVVLGAAVIIFTGYYIADPLLSVGIACILFYGSTKLVKESIDILLEKTPKHIKLDNVVETMKKIDGVLDVHDVRIWSVCSNVAAMSAHVVVGDVQLSDTERIIKRLNAAVASFGIYVTTFQMECSNCGREVVCSIEHYEESGRA